MIEPILNQTRVRMRKAVDVTAQDLSSIRSGRATPALVENVIISAYGGSQKLKLMEMATITTMDAKTIVISPYDPSQIADVSRSLQEANIGLTPIVDGELIRITIPPLSTERRQEYIRLSKTKLEAGKIMIRQIRADAMRDLKRLHDDKLISEDVVTHGEKMIQDLTDEVIAELEAMGERKEQELLQV